MSEDRTRMVDDDPPLAIAAYKIAPSKTDDGYYDGWHVGVFQNVEDAESWIRTGEPEPQKLYYGAEA